MHEYRTHQAEGHAETREVPDVLVQIIENEQPKFVATHALFSGKTVVAFALPGAYTPTCSSQHLPRFEELASTFRDRGIDEIVCFAVNDPYVMHAWSLEQGTRNVRMIADGNGGFAKAMGMLVERNDTGLGLRSRRYSMLVRDRCVERLFAEPEEDGDPYGVSDADTLLRYLDPAAVPPPRVALLTKPGCPHCARAKALLSEHALPYVEIPLADSQRARVLGAIAGASTAPQVFIDGKAIGGTTELENYLRGRG
jgi:glutathione-dependent peroxiredoxin